MKSGIRHPRGLLALICIAVTLARTTSAQQVLNPSNGHYYEAVASVGISWTAAKALAESMTYLGRPGHLVTLTDAAENAWVYANLPPSLNRHWIGAWQDHNSPTYSEPAGGWTWVTGEPWVFTAWFTPGEPNNYNGIEDFCALDHNLPVWNDIHDAWSISAGLIVEYEPTTLTFCTAGTTSNGCLPAISASGTPSASATSGFDIAVAAVEGQKQGLIFYGLDNTGFTPLPWGTSSSFLCVKSPTQRTPAQATGGTLNACDGALALDWNAFVATTPGALGAPFAAGRHVYAQGWFRDPPSPKTTMLSDALEFIVQP